MCGSVFERTRSAGYDAGESYEQRLQKMADGMCRHYQAAYEYARRFSVPVIAMGHLFAAGGGKRPPMTACAIWRSVSGRR